LIELLAVHRDNRNLGRHAHCLVVLGKAKLRAQKTQCIAISNRSASDFHLFANDHQNRFPMQSLTNDGGSLEYISHSITHSCRLIPSGTLRRWPRIDHPKNLICPSDGSIGRNDLKLSRKSMSVITFFATPMSADETAGRGSQSSDHAPRRRG